MDNIQNPSEAKEQFPEKEKPHEEIVEELYRERKEQLAEKEPSKEEEARIREMLEREVEKMEEVPKLREEAQKQGEQIKSLGTQGKIRQLLDLVETKGLIFTIGVAKEMKDPYILDILHDILAKEGFYKKFEK